MISFWAFSDELRKIAVALAPQPKLPSIVQQSAKEARQVGVPKPPKRQQMGPITGFQLKGTQQ